MSYQALARTWRPKHFAQVIGQDTVLQALTHALDTGRLHHAYLLTGTRGVGKTTIGRILAKCFNCQRGISSQPCGQCEQCCAIDQGNAVDLIEVDAASRTKVEDTRELLDNVQYRPTSGRFKIYLIDEVHMLSRHSFNALLKTLEEPPEYVKFILATTDPQKLPITVLSRCLQFHLKALKGAEISQHLAAILQQEGHRFEPAALTLLGDAADGSVRDALTLTDQILAFGQGQVSTTDVQAMLGIPEPTLIHNLIEALAQLNLVAALHWVEELRLLGADFAVIHRELAKACHVIAKLQLLPPNSPHPWQHVAQALTPEQVQLWYHMAITGLEELPLAPSGAVGLEMTLLKMIAFSPKATPPLAAQWPTAPEASAMPLPAPEPALVEPAEDTFAPTLIDLAHEQQEIETIAQTMRNDPPLPAQSQSAPPFIPQALSELNRTKALLEHRRALRAREQSTATTTAPRPKDTPPVAPTYQPRPPEPLITAAPQDIPWATAPAPEPAASPEAKKKISPEPPLPLSAPPQVLIPDDEHWAEYVAQRPVGGLLQQILLNSVCRQEGATTYLHLQDPALKHLLTPKALQDLQQALSPLGQINAVPEPLPQRISPKGIASRKAQQRYDEACANLAQDPHVAWIKQTFNATLQPDTVQLCEKSP